VAVEKLPLRAKQPKIGGCKMSLNSKTSLKSKRDAKLFSRIFLKKSEFFDSHGIFQQYSRARGKPRHGPQ